MGKVTGAGTQSDIDKIGDIPAASVTQFRPDVAIPTRSPENNIVATNARSANSVVRPDVMEARASALAKNKTPNGLGQR